MNHTIRSFFELTIVIDKSKISRIIEVPTRSLAFVESESLTPRIQEIDIYDYKAKKDLPTISLKTKYNTWNIGAIDSINFADSTTTLDTLEQRNFKQQLCRYTKNSTCDEWNRAAYWVQPSDERAFSTYALPRSAMAKEEIRYTPARVGTQKPYVCMYEPGFWRKLIYERRRTLLAEDQPLIQTGHYHIFNLLNPLA